MRQQPVLPDARLHHNRNIQPDRGFHPLFNQWQNLLLLTPPQVEHQLIVDLQEHPALQVHCAYGPVEADHGDLDHVRRRPLYGHVDCLPLGIPPDVHVPAVDVGEVPPSPRERRDVPVPTRAGDCVVDEANKELRVKGRTFREGDFISLDGTTGRVIAGKLKTLDAQPDDPDLVTFMAWVDPIRRLKIRANADIPRDAKNARLFGAEGIGLCRTEHMFFAPDRLPFMQEMILADTEADRRKALDKLLPFQKEDFKGLLKEMKGYGVTIRTLDPPLHEFLPKTREDAEELSKKIGVPTEKILAKTQELHEFNPMLGHRGCRLGITYPEITEMQSRAIIEAAMNLKAKGVDARPEIMVPLIGTVAEFTNQAAIINATAEKVFAERGDRIDYLVGTMIEVPRAALTADGIAKEAQFFSFGTNDLTQMTMGFSRDDAGKFLPAYLEKGILKQDPFQVLDRHGVGQLVQMAVTKGRSTRPDIKLGICGEHGGDPSSIEFCDMCGLDYVSCSPFRVPIARLAAAQANIRK